MRWKKKRPGRQHWDIRWRYLWGDEEHPGYLDITPADLKEIYKFAYRHAWERITQSVKAHDIMTEKSSLLKRTLPERSCRLMAKEKISGVRSSKIMEKSRDHFWKRLSLQYGLRRQNHFMAFVAECLGGKVALPFRWACKRRRYNDLTCNYSQGRCHGVRDFKYLLSKEYQQGPVADREGKLLGIVSRADIVRASMITAKPLHRGREAAEECSGLFQ